MTLPPHRASLVLVVLGCISGHSCEAQEIAPFRITGIEGYITTRYLRDTATATSLGAAESRQGITDMRQDVFLMTHSYVYHPNFLLLDVGGGPILQGSRIQTESSDTSGRKTLYNFTARATFLRDKPYRGSLYYEHLNPVLTVAPGVVLAQENTRYGFDASVLAPASPVPVHVSWLNSRSQASGADRVIDDRTERLGVRGSRTLGSIGITQFSYQALRQESASGSLNLPIQSTTSTSQGVTVDTRLHFGDGNRVQVGNVISLNGQSYNLRQGNVPERRDLRFLLDGRVRHGDELQSYASMNYNTSHQGDLTSNAVSGVANIVAQLRPDTSVTAGVHGDTSEVAQFRARTVGVSGTVQHQRTLPIGSVQLAYSARYDQRSQQSGADVTPVIGERVTLTGTSFVSLARPRVSAGSVVVTNATRTQTFVEGLDYAVGTLGQDTRLQRLIGGNILDGQDLLVDYSYDSGGTFAYTQFDQSLNANWAVSSLLNVYMRYFESTPSITSGSAVYPLNVVHSTVQGARLTYPLPIRFNLSMTAGVERETRRETIAPYRRTSSDLSVTGDEPFFSSGTVALGYRRTLQQYDNGLPGINLESLDLRYVARPRYGIEFGANANHEQDTGGDTQRKRITGSVDARWRYRKVSVTVSLSRTHEMQGDAERSRTAIQMLARRDF